MKIWNFIVLGSILAAVTQTSLASEQGPHLECKALRSSYSFKVYGGGQVAVQRTDDRQLASVGASARTKNTLKGWKKFFSVGQHHFALSIAQKGSYSQIDDFVSIRNGRGHEITYSLECRELAI